MYIVLVLLSLVYAVVPQYHTPSHQALINFNFVTDCVIGGWGTRYNHYGCWCGKGGSGTPIDAIDRCCMHHDKCYDRAVASKVCGDIRQYFALYKWDCVKTPNGNRAVCRGTNTGCAAALCKCDTECVECWKNVKDSRGKTIIPSLWPFGIGKPGCPKK
ncbi:unnamed protein product [Cylicocyclus nassatus]|uniref:Phospholipase A2 n=1 Tax=Cylicocyclus nassatus TaxID=53992 RepID=A0AA36H6V1_CYLNA|nr:unnamed protein product [Cylicocyclus nassatus]